MYVSLRRYSFVAKVINNGHLEVKNKFGLEIADVMCPGRLMQIMGSIITSFPDLYCKIRFPMCGNYSKIRLQCVEIIAEHQTLIAEG